jgi:ribosomal protein L44E
MNIFSKLFGRNPPPEKTTLGQTCTSCHGATANNSDAYFRSFDVSYRCKCGAPVSIDGKLIDRLVGFMVKCAKCGAISYLPPTVWCQRCGQNLVGDWESLVVKDRVDEATTKFAKASQRPGAGRFQRFPPPQDAQRLKPPLIYCECDECGSQEWWNPNGHALHETDMMENQIVVRCLECGRWAIICE